jgi:hypothetical protein
MILSPRRTMGSLSCSNLAISVRVYDRQYLRSIFF